MQYRTVTFFGIVPLAIIVMVLAGLFAPRRSGKEIPLLPPLSKGDERGILFQRVRVGSVFLNAEIAATPEARRQGLSGHAPLNDNEGMLFVFDAPAPQTFLMINMLFPLDIIWIGAGKRVIGITRDVPAPQLGTSSDKLPLYSSPSPAQYVLEVNAGWSGKHGVKVGDEVTW